MKTIATKSSYDGVTVPAPATQVHTAEELNDRIVEMEGSVTDSGQTLDVLDAGQLSKAIFANAVAAQSMQDNGGVNTVELTPITGASGLRVATPLVKDYSLLDGAIFSFKANNTNTGNMTVNVGQAVGSYIGAQPLFLADGTTNVPVGDVVAGSYYSVRYDSSLDVDGAFVVIDGIVSGQSIQVVRTVTGAASTTTTVTPIDDTIPQYSEGAEFMSRTITPSSASNLLKIDVVFNYSLSAAARCAAHLHIGTTANSIACAGNYNTATQNNTLKQLVFTYIMVAGTTSEIEFNLVAGPSVGTLTFNGVAGSRVYGGVLASSIVVTEIGA